MKINNISNKSCWSKNANPIEYTYTATDIVGHSGQWTSAKFIFARPTARSRDGFTFVGHLQVGVRAKVQDRVHCPIKNYLLEKEGCCVFQEAFSILTNDICMIGLSLCTFCAFVKERWCRKQIRPFCNLVVIVINITHNNPIWEVLLITSQVFKSPKTKKDLGPRWPGPSSSLSPPPFLMLRYVLMLLKPKWQSSSRIWSQSRSLFCHQSASCDHSQPTNAVQIQIQILKVQVQIHLYKHKLLLQLSANQCNAHCKMY